jgi:nicotinate-nucleotide adenylyltransferase
MDRLKMVKIATDDNMLFETSDIEINRNGPTYTIDTLNEFQKLYNGEIYFIIGYDTLIDMDSWKMVDCVFELAHFVVVNRGNLSNEMHKEILRKQKLFDADLLVVDIPDIQISSTGIREKVKAGDSIKYLVPDAVEDYICLKGLYSNGL